MYTHFQRFVATLLLFSLLLQSCGNPNWRIADDASPRGASTQTYHPAKVKQRSASFKLATAESFTEGPSEHCRALSAALPSECYSEALSAVSGEVPPAVYHKPPSTPFFAPAHVIPQRAPSNSSPRSTSTTPKAAIKHHANKPRHVVLGKDSIALRKGAPLTPSCTVAPVVAARPTQPQAPQPTSFLHAEKLHPVFSSQPQPKVPHALKATERKEAHFNPATSLVLQPYPSAQGHQVCFQEADSKWLAQVQDRWGRAQLLPVVCAPDQTPTQALHKLASKSPGQHKYWVHVLETNQTPWAPRVVYVGALGLRGGGNISSAPDSDDETSSVNPFSTYRGNIQARADFYQAAGFWHANVNYSNRYNSGSNIYNSYATAVPVRWPPSVLVSPLLSFSANDLNESRNSMTYHHLDSRITNIDYIEVISSPTEVLSARTRRRDRRQEEARRQEEDLKRRREEFRRQVEDFRRDLLRREEERRQQEEARRREEERLEAIRLAEERAAQELARVAEEARVAELQAMRGQLQSHFASQALPELNLRLGELGIAYQEIPLSVFYNAIQTAMTQVVPDVQMPNNPDDLQAAEDSVNEFLAGMQEAFNDPGVALPPALKKVLAEIDIEAFRPHARALVAQVEAAQAAKAALIEANEVEVKESIARIQASAEELHQKNQAIAQQKAKEKETEEAVARERQAARYRATKDIAVLSSEHFFVPETSVGFLKELQDDLQTLQEDLLEIPVTEQLPPEVQEEIKYIWSQINKDQKALTPLYRHLRKSIDHYATNMLNNEQAKKALSLRTAQEAHSAFTQTQLEALDQEAAIIKKGKNNELLAKEILEELDNMRQALCEILEARQVLLVDYDLEVYVPDWKADYALEVCEPDWKNDYSQEELVSYMASCSQVPQDVREQVFVVSLQATAAEFLTNIRATLGQPMPVTTQDFLDLFQSAPQVGQQVVAYYPYIADIPTNSVAFAHIHGLVMHAIFAGDSMRTKIEIRHLNEFKKRMHQLSIAIKQVLSNPQKLLC